MSDKPMNGVHLLRGYLASSVAVRMCSSRKSYEDAVCKLNLLQSNKASIEQIRKDIRTGQVSNIVAELQKKCTNLEDMESYLARTGVSMAKLDQLSVIHIAGTKGKGSTSAMCESILRHHGFRTGFYSSPHLVAVRERIRLNGRVLSEDQFAQYFHQVYDLLDGSKAYEGDMPKYFAFLTVMAFNVFLKEKVDVALVEVGIGGIVDYTNILRKVPVVGITALGLDHTTILGNTLPEIAAAKAGIMKPGCEAYTVTQPNDAMDVLRNVADSFKCPLTVVPDYKSYTFPNTDKVHLPVNLEAYQTNASLAIQLAHAWMRITKSTQRKNGLKKLTNNVQNDIKLESVVKCVTKETMEGLTSCKWPGRYQVINAEYAEFYLDGAHTKESMDICAQWFRDSNRLHDRTLIFSATGDRNGETLLQPLRSLGFTSVYFVIPTAYRHITQNNDNYSKVEDEELIARCQKHADIWLEFQGSAAKVTVAGCVADALVSIKKNKVDRSSVLITGSLHLVGAALSILDPNLVG
ncbi:folylpolyglutamate synthase, mitochondrial-like isoform X2 [Anticarsia gemmatalis]|uniref:folylpolyglutamate synthase, mitochondrial-like isoform X2 n=1 Tax=Anticarsia gemmatalis TaxID=129554 RepID=UPI003F7656BE